MEIEAEGDTAMVVEEGDIEAGFFGADRGRYPNNNGNSQGRQNTRGRGHGIFQGNGANSRNVDQSISCGYSTEEWQNLSQADWNRVYRARDRLETSRTEASILRVQTDQIPDDVSALTPLINNPGNSQNDNGNPHNVA